MAGLLHRTTVDPTVDSAGHTRGNVNVELMRQIMTERARAVPAAPEPRDRATHRVPSQSHPLLGRSAPQFALKDSLGKTWRIQRPPPQEPVILVFYLGQTCMACVTHLVQLDFAISQFESHGARVLAISADSPEFSRQRLDRLGDLQVPLLGDSDHATALAYGVWKPAPGGDGSGGLPLHGTFIVDRAGVVRWAHTGDQPFSDVRRPAGRSPGAGTGEERG